MVGEGGRKHQQNSGATNEWLHAESSRQPETENNKSNSGSQLSSPTLEKRQRRAANWQWTRKEVGGGSDPVGHNIFTIT